MDAIEKLIAQAEKEGGWNDRLTEEYFSSQEQEFYQDNDNCSIRPYSHKDRAIFGDLISTVGDFSVEEIQEEGCDINLMEKDARAIGAIVYKDDGIGTYVNAIAVSDNFRGRGYASQLIASVDDGRPMSAKISTDNESSIRTFQKYGFQPAHVENGKRWMIRE